ncbi:thioesterase II family protein [Streptomyces sp. NBC_01304]|uniref:thioesterase II family protein n=1 Tax=Streptomyces sp. NBC_01304 TaxID=2903818 RepID=UPI002E0E3520|nr:alpha/beta fold hydrolase [Streptomyces sp. NBC_01304]
MTGIPGDSPWFRNYRPAPDAPTRLFCLPHAGGSASFYFPVARALAPRTEVFGVQYPGRQDRRDEPAVRDLETLADQICDALRPAADERPYALFGHSMGAILGFLIARRMEAEGIGPAELFVSGRRAPVLDRDDSRQPGTDEEVIAEIRALDGTGGELLEDPEMLDMILPALRGDYAAVRRYRYRPGASLSCPVTAFTGDDDPKADVDEVRAWEGLTLGGFRLRVLPGGHFFLVDQQDEVLGTVAERLALARTPAAV